jgi:C1A family cysteine protease
LACDKGGNGCNGGMMDQAFDWVAQNGITSLTDEPYLCQDAKDVKCTAMTCGSQASQDLVLAVGDVVKHTDVDATEMALEAAVAQQPVSVAIEADEAVFQHYTGGILTNDAGGSSLDHGVLVVGYGVDTGQKYWKVKNSWGVSFGEDGYIRIEKGKNGTAGECGIRKMASFPTIKNMETLVV